MQRDLVYMRDLQESALLAVTYLEGISLESFREQTQLQDAVIRRLEIIGEAARRVSDDTRTLYPNLPWHLMIGMRNQVIHKYDGVDLDVVWRTVLEDLPELLALLGCILGGEEN